MCEMQEQVTHSPDAQNSLDFRRFRLRVSYQSSERFRLARLHLRLPSEKLGSSRQGRKRGKPRISLL
eukprot:4514946-Amphidinium_carterae.1